MGIVYEAIDEHLERKVAIKSILLNAPEDEFHILTEQIKKEAKAAAKMHHHNIVAIYDFGFHDAILSSDAGNTRDKREHQFPYIVMQYVEGADLKQHIRGGRSFALAETAKIMAQLVDALDYAHAHGILHRDVKPANIFLGKDGNVVLGDFGVARVITADFTSTNFFGSPAYAAPEALDGRPGKSSDLYSAAAVMYELLTGRRVFTEQNVALSMAIHTKTPDAPSRHNGLVTYKLDKFVLRSLSKDPKDRYKTGEMMATGLADALSHTKTTLQRPARQQEAQITQIAASRFGEGLDSAPEQDLDGTLPLPDEAKQASTDARRIAGRQCDSKNHPPQVGASEMPMDVRRDASATALSKHTKMPTDEPAGVPSRSQISAAKSIPAVMAVEVVPAPLAKQFGKYQLRRAIGNSASGIVYEGFDPIVDRLVAIKTIKKNGLNHEEAEEHSRRFLIQAKVAARLSHKNIVGIYDYGEEKGLSFIVMEFVQGKELKSFFAARHPFSMSQIVRLMGELLDALGYSHSRGVIHRDVKPDNIFVTDDGSVKLGDFGIARIDSTSKTHAGTVLGTPSYMAPEQIRGETADARSDLYAAGVILYQFLVGERPFSGGMVAVMQKVLMEAPKPPSTHNPSIPESIDAVVLRALAKAAGDRFASAAEFSRELTAAVGLADAQDESESTMIMSSAQMKALQDGLVPRTERTSAGTGSTYTGTRTGTGATGTVGRAGGVVGRGAAVEEAKRRAEEAKRRYEEDFKRAEVDLQQAEAEQRAAEIEAQAQADAFMAASQSLLDESEALRLSSRGASSLNSLLSDRAVRAIAKTSRAVATKIEQAVKAIDQFVLTSYALSPSSQAVLERHQAGLRKEVSAQLALAKRLERRVKKVKRSGP